MGCPEFHSVLGTRDKNGETAGTSLTVQWLRFRSPSAGGTGSIPGWKTKILHACRVWPKIKKKKNNKKSDCSYIEVDSPGKRPHPYAASGWLWVG